MYWTEIILNRARAHFFLLFFFFCYPLSSHNLWWGVKHGNYFASLAAKKVVHSPTDQHSVVTAPSPGFLWDHRVAHYNCSEAWSSQAFIFMFTFVSFAFLLLCSSPSPYVEPMVKPPFDDIDPEYGLHGYQLHLVLHDTACELLSGSFSQLFCRRSNSFKAFSWSSDSCHSC